MTGRYERLLIDSCPQRRGWLRVTAGLSALPGCLRLWPGVIPRASQTLHPAHARMSAYILWGGQTLPHHSSSCLVISCVSVKPFPPLVRACFLLFWHSTIWHVTLTFHFPFLSSLHVCMHAEMFCACVCVLAFFFFPQPDGLVFFSVSTNCSSPDTSVSVSSVEAWGNEALRVYWSPYTPLCIRETLFSMPNRNTAPSILYTAPRHQLLFSRSSVPGGLW